MSVSVECASAEIATTTKGFCRTVRIGGVSLSLIGPSTEDVRLSSGVDAFEDDSGDPDIEVRVRWSECLSARAESSAFDSGAVWQLFHQDDDFVFDFSSPCTGPNPYKRLHVARDFCSAQLTLSSESLRPYNSVTPLEYPADELLITNYLAHHGLGVEVHGCGLVDAETGGHLLLGHSGAGKSTTARLWDSTRNVQILSDDRIILRIENGELWMYGTPWHGEAAFALPKRARINAILVLQHAECNQIAELGKCKAVAELFARCFPPFHSAVGLQQTVTFLERVAQTVPCFEFGFVPDASAVQAVVAHAITFR